MTIESLQDTATYDSDQKNMGFSADIDIAGGGAGSSLSVNGGKTNVNADYKGVGEQSGLFTGDGSFDLAAKGKTTLIGGAITTTDAAVAAGRNNYMSLGGIKTQDIENTTSYEGDAISVGLSVGKAKNPSMNGLGYGTDGDSDSSVTRAGITGVAGNKDITTDNRAEYAGILENSFDANQVNEELGAQTQITQEFGKEAPKAVAEFSQNRIDDIRANPNLSADEKKEAIKKWDEGGVYRVAAHTALSALGTGSVEGALTTGSVAATALTISKVQEKIVESLIASGMSEDVAKGTASGVISLTLLGAGSVAGLDTSSTVTATNVDANNRKLHFSEMTLLNKSAQDLYKKYGRSVEYWESILYGVTYSHLDSKGKDKLDWLTENLEEGPKYSLNGKAFADIIERDLAVAEQVYQNLKATYGNKVLPKDKNSSSKQDKDIKMFGTSGYYTDNSIYGTYGGSYQANRNKGKKYNDLVVGLDKQMIDVATRGDRITPLFPEQYYIPLSELKALSTVGLSAAKTLAQKKARDQLLKDLKGLSVNANLKHHLANVDGFSRSKGIQGGHNRANFEAELKKQGGRITSESPTGVDGIVTVRYEIPKLDRAGNLDGWKSISSPKTVYDPVRFSDSEVLEMGLEAAAKGYNEAVRLGKRQYDETINGVKFHVYIDQKIGAINNVHPQ